MKKKTRNQYCSKRVKTGLKELLKRIDPETECEFKAIEFLRDLLSRESARLQRLLAQDALSPQIDGVEEFAPYSVEGEERRNWQE